MDSVLVPMVDIGGHAPLVENPTGGTVTLPLLILS